MRDYREIMTDAMQAMIFDRRHGLPLKPTRRSGPKPISTRWRTQTRRWVICVKDGSKAPLF
jgi:hypothetical protein